MSVSFSSSLTTVPQPQAPQAPQHEPVSASSANEMQAASSSSMERAVALLTVHKIDDEAVMRKEMELCAEAAARATDGVRKPLKNNQEYLNLFTKANYPITIETHRADFHVCGYQAGRSEMQDFVIEGTIKDSYSEASIRYMAVLDGHGEAALPLLKFIIDNFEKTLASKLPKKPMSEWTPKEIRSMIDQIFGELNENLNKPPYNERAGGTTFSLAIQLGKVLYAANVGDSRLAILKKNGAVALTEDAKMGNHRCTRFGEKMIQKLKDHGLWKEEMVDMDKWGEIKVASTTKENWFSLVATTMGDFLEFPELIRDPAISGPYEINEGDLLFGATDGPLDTSQTAKFLKHLKD